MSQDPTPSPGNLSVKLLREELVSAANRIADEAAADLPDKALLTSIRTDALHLRHLLEEHLTEERIRILDTVQPLWVPDAEKEGPPPQMPPDPLAGSIVVIDDEPALSEPLCRQLRRDGYSCVEFTDGAEALRHIESHPCMMILLDVVMPGLGGREVLERIKSTESLSDIPVIMTAQRHELDHIAGSIHEGAEDFLAKPYNTTIVRARVASSIQRRQLRDLEQKTFQALVKSRNQLAGELSEAAEYVTSLLPAKLTSPVATDWCYIPSSQLGGDSFSYHWIDRDHLALYLLDVCGHGVGAALLSVSVLNFLRSGALAEREARDPAGVLARLNATFPMEGHNDMFFSIWYGVYNARSRELSYSSGGHPPALLLDPEGAMECLSTGGTVIGAFSSSRYTGDKKSVKPGSLLYLFSDGAYEIGGSGSPVMGHEDFASLIAAMHGERRLERLIAIIRERHGRDDFDDDLSVLEFRFLENGKADIASVSLINRMEELPRLLSFTQDFGVLHGLSREDLIDLDVILEEMVTNIIKYGGLPPDSEACTVELSLQDTRIVIRIADNGIPFNPLEHPEVDTAKGIEERPIGGLGIHFVKNLTLSQSYEYRERKNILTLTKVLRS
jgi:sigma-B regulation protein RsbU (phosphoserine phosphatase)